MDNYTDKAAERLLGRLAPPAVMGEKRALGLTAGGAGLGGLIGLLRSRKNEKARGTGYGAGIGAGTGLGAGLGAGVGGLAGLSGGALIAALLNNKEGINPEDLLRMTAEGGVLGAGLGGLAGAGLGGYGGYRVSKSLAEDVAGEKGLPWGENEEEAKEASARGELSLVLLKRAMRKAAELPSSKGMLDMSSFGGGMADYLTPGSWGGERAGRAQALASAVGEDTPFSVRHPTTTDMLGAAGGAALGAGIGGLAGGFGHGGEGAMTAGGIGGGLLGALLTAFIRRRNMKKIVEKYEGKRHGVDPEDVERPDLESASALLLPGRGPHRTGQTETVRAMKGEDSIGKQHTGGRDALYTAAMLPYVGGLIGLGHGYGQNITTHTKGKEDKAFDRRLRGMKLRDGDGDGKVNDGTPEEREVNKEEAKAASARGVLSPVLLQRAMEKQSDLQDIIKGTGEAVKSTGEAVSGYWSRYVNALKGGTIVDQLVNPEKAKLHQLLAMAGTGALGGGALGMLNESRKKKEDRDLLGGGMFGGALGGLGGLGAWAANPVGQWQYKDGASIR